MPIIISFILLVLTGTYLFVSSAFAQSLSVLARLHDLIQKFPVIFDAAFLGIAVIAFAVSFASIFFIRNSSLVIGSKKFLLIFSVIALLAVIVLGFRLYRHLEPAIQKTLSGTNTAE